MCIGKPGTAAAGPHQPPATVRAPLPSTASSVRCRAPHPQSARRHRAPRLDVHSSLRQTSFLSTVEGSCHGPGLDRAQAPAATSAVERTTASFLPLVRADGRWRSTRFSWVLGAWDKACGASSAPSPRTLAPRRAVSVAARSP
ncbi:uncharacterized protein LOC123443060 [Hordeum vulgare subsp. vulgare]|uniref:Predicted protein n=1 Tax=Hordeum vulgare subsp. vulgare TaxID=112509 RepID=F2EDU6_HORVV|nr:uncharacterized protein LOC123443060 [Hordeum vulgare subsp. vulgare]BAK05518.1 predicted protein [Hordeum vulgare subsp. vulgare]